MEKTAILNLLQYHYHIPFQTLELTRDSGSLAFTAFADDRKYFLRAVKPVFLDTAQKSVDIHVFLQNQGFAVPSIIFTNGMEPYVRMCADGMEYLLILYEFLEGGEVDPEVDAESIGALLGRFHHIMQEYPGELTQRDKQFYIGRYIDILRERRYPKANEFAAYGEALWDRVKDLPRGYCHGDMYRGNIHKTPEGSLYILDLDTSCKGFPMVDPALICNMTDYFLFDDAGKEKSKKVLDRFLPEYEKHHSLTQAEIAAFDDLIAIYHYQLQATIIELFGPDCVDNAFFDSQLDWLYRWREK